MNPLAAFLKLVRWPNLIFIILTQVLFFTCVLPFVYRTAGESGLYAVSVIHFSLLTLASVFIAAAGYIINDYFDLNIDQINKPKHLVLEKYINRRSAILSHLLLSFAGFAISCYVGYKIKNIYIPFFNLISIALLWFYSTTFKRKLLIGNIIISLLTSWVILVITFAEYKAALTLSVNARLIKISLLYAGFAFIISLIREVIKDMEDMPGDTKYGCKTMPIIWGIPVSKVFAAVWLIVLCGTIGVLQIYVLQLGWWFSALYCICFLILPLLWILKKLYESQTSANFHQISTAVKLVMLSGIASMLFFRLYL